MKFKTSTFKRFLFFYSAKNPKRYAPLLVVSIFCSIGLAGAITGNSSFPNSVNFAIFISSLLLVRPFIEMLILKFNKTKRGWRSHA